MTNQLKAQSAGTVEYVWLHLCRGVRAPTTSNKYSGYDTKPSDGEALFHPELKTF